MALYLGAIAHRLRMVHIRSGNGEIIARVLSRQSGHENAPEDKVALQNAKLFELAPRMRDALDVVLEREFEPMHPRIADAVRALLAEIDEGAHASIGAHRQMNRLVNHLRDYAEYDSAQDETEEEPDHLLDW